MYFDEVKVVGSKFAIDDNYIGYVGTVMHIDNDDELNICVEICDEKIWFNEKELEIISKN